MKGLAKTTALVVATLLGLAVLWTFRGPTLIFLLSLVVAAAVRAPIEHLAGRGLPKPAALAGVYAAGFLVLAVLTVAVGYLASDELSRAGEDFRQLYEYSTRHSSPVLWIEHVAGVRMPPADELLTALLGRHGGQAVRLVLGTAFGAASAVVDIVLVVVLSIYWASDCAYFERFWLSLLPLPERASARDLWRMLETELGAYVRSEIAQSLLAGVLLGAGYHLLGLSYPATGRDRCILLAAAVAGRGHCAGGAGIGRFARFGPRLARRADSPCHGGAVHDTRVCDPGNVPGAAAV